MKKTGDENRIKRIIGHTMSALKSFFKRIARWGERMFGFGKNELDVDSTDVEIESPAKLLWRAFFRKKTAVAAVVVLLGIFLFVFIAPIFMPMDVNYTDPLQQNVAPSYSLCSVPKKLKKSIAYIDGFADFTVGLSTDGSVFVWGSTKDRLQGFNLITRISASGAAPENTVPSEILLPAATPAIAVPWPFSSMEGTIESGFSLCSARSINSFPYSVP